MSTTFPCISLIDDDSIRSVFSLAGGEKISFIVYGPIVLIISIFNIGVLIGVKAYRQPPSDILIFTNIFAVLKIVVIYSTMIYNDIYPEDSQSTNFQNFCIGTGFISVLADMAKGLYTVVFCLYYTRKVRNPLKTWTGHNKELHFICILIVLLITFAIYLSGKIGLTPYGYCGIAFTQSSAFVSPSIWIAYTLVLIFASIMFLRYIRKIETNNQQTKSYLKYYITFIFLFCFNQTILVVCSFIVSSTCTQQTNFGMFSNAKILGNCCAALSPIFILIVVLSNDKNRKIVAVQICEQVRQKFRRWRIRREHWKRRQRMSYGEELMSHRDSFGIELNEMRNLDGYISQLKNKTRACLLSTILGCLSIHHLQLKNYTELGLQLRTSAVEEDKQVLFLWNFSEKSGFSLTNSIKSHYQDIFISNLQIIKVYFTAYAPNVLNQFLEMDGIVGVGQTLAPNYNTQQIVNDSFNGDQGGGRSGQFFFFNHDRSLILKTLSKIERQVFIERVQLFYEHYRTHLNSLIVKFYSVFTVDLVDLQEHFDFILMGNILKKIDRKYVLRTYDLKGSTHSREVLKSDSAIQPHIAKTMKDIDFQRLQSKIWVSLQDRISLWQRIQADSRFLMAQGLIDYSLIVIKIDLKTLQYQNADYNLLLQGVSFYRSIREEGVAYLLGIIDYLQTWNFRKKGEKWYKSIFTKTEKISSQDPGFYSDRFISFCQEILTPK